MPRESPELNLAGGVILGFAYLLSKQGERSHAACSPLPNSSFPVIPNRVAQRLASSDQI